MMAGVWNGLESARDVSATNLLVWGPPVSPATIGICCQFEVLTGRIFASGEASRFSQLGPAFEAVARRGSDELGGRPGCCLG